MRRPVRLEYSPSFRTHPRSALAREEISMTRCSTAGFGVLLLLAWPPAARTAEDAANDRAKAVAAARAKGLDWLTKNQAADGSWGKTHSIAVTSFACLAYLSATDEPFRDERGKALVKGL